MWRKEVIYGYDYVDSLEKRVEQYEKIIAGLRAEVDRLKEEARTCVWTGWRKGE